MRFKAEMLRLIAAASLALNPSAILRNVKR
jgi:hypothetical protein